MSATFVSHYQDRSFRTARAVLALMLREMSTTYGRNPGGYIWAIASPVAAITVMVIAFSLIMRDPQLGTSFALFYASGYLAFSFALSIADNVGSAIRYSRQLLAYPAVTFIDAILARLLLTMLTKFVIATILFLGIRLILDVQFSVDPYYVASTVLMATSLGLGLGMFNCYLMNLVPVYEQVWGIVSRPLVLASSVVMLHDNKPKPLRDWLDWNPFVHVVGQMRKAFYPLYDGPYIDPLYVYLFSLPLLVLGLLLLHRHYRTLLQG